MKEKKPFDPEHPFGDLGKLMIPEIEQPGEVCEIPPLPPPLPNPLADKLRKDAEKNATEIM